MEYDYKPTSFNYLNEIIASRRAVYPEMYTGESIDDKTVEVILNNAKWAPNHRKTEPWLFHVISGKARERLSEYVGNWYKENAPGDQYSPLKFERTRQKPLSSSHVIAICMQRDPQERLPEWEEIAAVACAVQNMWLTCTALQLGCYWSTPGSALQATDFLKLGPGQRCLGWFYIGVPKTGIILKGERTDMSAKTIWHRV